MRSAYEVRNLRKLYKSPPVVANDDISFSIEPGTTFGLLGPNGAGKTTLVKQLVGLLRPTSGEVRLFDEQVGNGADRRVSRLVAYLPQTPLPLGELKVAEAIRWTGMLRGLGNKAADAESIELMDTLQIGRLRDRQVRKLSGGERRLTQIAMTLVGRLSVLILDEPTADIDPVLRARIWSLIGDRAREGAAVILVTHDVAEAEHALERVAILDRGRVAAEGTPAELKAGLADRTRLEVVVASGAALAPSEVALSLGADAQLRGRKVSSWVPGDEAITILDKIIASAGADSFEDVRLVTPTLEDVYIEVTGHTFQQEAS